MAQTHAQINARYRAANRVKLNLANVEYRQQNPEKTLLTIARSRAKRNGIPFTLTLEDIQIPEFCPIFPNLRLERGAGQGKFRQDNIPSIDRIRPELGYIKGNVWVISWKANRLKNNATPEELMQIANAVIARRGII